MLRQNLKPIEDMIMQVRIGCLRGKNTYLKNDDSDNDNNVSSY